ncbi:MAG: A/G-specific adenine glycosylase, partial [Gammaproteobacteria bacterium]
MSWFDLHGRKDLPWQQPATPYRVWISEIMLQQTQVATVIPYFEKFMNRFPCVEALSDAPLDEVLLHWAGLGYYARARNLHKSARLIAANGTFPNCFDDLVELPGIGRSTAGAILSLAFGRSHPILDGNVKRVLARFEGITGWPGNNATAEALWAVSSRYTPVHRAGEYTQAMMDLGATLCTRSKPDCPVCPLKDECHARRYEQTASLPTPKPSRTQPVKRVCFLWVTDRDRQTFLQQRPAAGIWGGLWSLPEFDSPESARVWCLSRNIVITRQRQLPEQ